MSGDGAIHTCCAQFANSLTGLQTQSGLLKLYNELLFQTHWLFCGAIVAGTSWTFNCGTVAAQANSMLTLGFAAALKMNSSNGVRLYES